jgi:hypothetical protein
MVNNSLTFALGPRLLCPGDEDSPDKDGDDETQDDDTEDEQGEPQEDGDENIIDEETTLLPRHHVHKANKIGFKYWKKGNERWERLPPWALHISFSMRLLLALLLALSSVSFHLSTGCFSMI